jgi:hypothetical protein
MRSNTFKSVLIKSGLAASVLLLASGISFAQSVSLTAARTTTTLPDGSQVPMWGYSCTTAVAPATCAASNTAAGTAWSPVVITAPPGSLTINLTNSLPAAVPETSLVIVGQLGAGLGTARSTTASPTHADQVVTWAIAGDTSGATNTPPPQGQRVQSFSTPVAPGATQALTWTNLKPGTYLIESGTHPSIQGPMGLYGILVVTTAPTNTGSTNVPGTAYPATPAAAAVTYGAEIPVLLSEIDPIQNTAVDTAVTTTGFSETSVRVLRDSVSSVTVDADPVSGNPLAGTGYTVGDIVVIGGGGYTAQATAHVSQVNGAGGIVAVSIDNSGAGYTAVPNTVSVTSSGTGASLTANLSLAGVVCSGGAAACYPPAVNYTPLYYLVNGVAFNNKSSATSAMNSLINPLPSTATAPVTGSVLVRFVNAGLRMHVPSIVGAMTTPAIVPTGVTAVQTPGFSLVAEDGNRLPGVSRVQSEVFLAAGKTYDVMIDLPTPGATALPVFDRELSLSANSIARDSGMLAYLSINGAVLPSAATAAFANVQANPDLFNSVLAGQTLTVSDPGKGVLANDINVTGAHVIGTPPSGLTLNPDGTFVYTAGTPANTPITFTYCGNGTTLGAACALVTLGAAPVEAAGNISCNLPTTAYTATTSTTLSIKPPGILSFCKDSGGYALTVSGATSTTPLSLSLGSGTVTVDQNGGFNATVSGAGTYSFQFAPQNGQGTTGSPVTVHLAFPAPAGIKVALVDGSTKVQMTDGAFGGGDFRWIIEEDRTFYINPACTDNPPAAGCPTAGGIVPTFGTNFHTSYMPVVAAGCTGPLSCEGGQSVGGVSAVCDVGNGVCRTGSNLQQAPLDPATVHLDPTKRYYLSVLPGDAANSFENAGGCLNNATPSCGHGMGGTPIVCTPTTGNVVCTAAAATGAFPAAVNVVVQPNPFPPSKLSVFVFQDDFPLNGEQDAGGGIGVISPNEPGLGGFNITLFDDAGGTGDATGQMTYDMFNMPLSNGLAGTIDPATGLDACPVSGANQNQGFDGTASPTGITGTIVTCPKFEKGGVVLSPLAGQAVISNLMPGRYGVVATPGADRIARGEEWLQTNTLDGQKAHDSFLRIGEPSYFQEFGPAGFHVSIGFANPGIINGRKPFICDGSDPNSPNAGTPVSCTNSVTGTVTTERMSRTPDERLYSSGDNSSFAFTQCYVSLGDPDGEDFAFTKCDSNGNFTLSGLPDGDWRVTVFDQWNDMLVDGLSTPVRLGKGATTNLGQIATNQWQANIYTATFFDTNGNGVRDSNEQGLTLVATNNRFRDGSYSNFNNTDLSGNAGFNEIFPLFSWYVIETDSTRYKSTGMHVVYDAGGSPDIQFPVNNLGVPQPCPAGQRCTNIAGGYAATTEAIPVPSTLRVPGAYYCATADCANAPTPLSPGGPGGSTGRVDPPFWFGSEGWQGFSGQNQFIEFGKKPYAVGETGGIHGEVIYASTRPFDDPTLLIHTSWTPDVPGVTINLYKEGTAPDGSTSLTLIDTTKTSSWDDWAQGFRSDGKPNMNCPGQGRDTGTNADLFFFSIMNQTNWLDQYNNGVASATPLPNNSQFKCYDGMHNWNQIQPAPYDGMYQFPSVTAFNPTTGKPAGTNCTACVPNPDASDTYRVGTPMLPAGKYVVEMVVPPGYELVKEEDKNILIGDNYIAPVTQQFAGLGNIFILPDQAEVSAYSNPNNVQNPTNTLGRTTLPSHEGDTGSVETFWPCVGAQRVVPDYISLFPQSGEVAPFAGATRNLCDRKEVTLTDQSAALAKFWVFSSTHVAAHYTGVITDDFTSEFDPFSPQFGEKFSPPNLPISLKDWTGTEISRTYADHWGAYNGLTYSTWEVNPPNPTGYAPTMMVTCMNDPGTGAAPDPLFNPQYSQFCYEIPFMPGQTQYMDTPVIPTSAFAGAGYNNPDCAYPAMTPAIAEVDSTDGVGPWVNATASVASVTVDNGGSYTAVPNVTFSSPTTGTTATGTALMGVTITCPTTGIGSCSFSSTGNRYSAGAPTITIARPAACLTTANTPTCIGATATANMIGFGGARHVGSITVNSGLGYTSLPTVTITCGTGCTQGRALAVTTTLRVSAVNLTSGGSGYMSPPTVTFDSGTAAATAVLGNPVVTGSLTITALGDQMVPNNAYTGPSATTAPYNQKKVLRHYGFGPAQGAGTVTIGGVTAPVTNWSDTQIVVSVPSGVPLCPVQQQAQYGGSTNMQCGQLVVTTTTGQQSIDAVTVTIGGKAPTHVDASGSIQAAIDAASPGDLIIIDPTCNPSAGGPGVKCDTAALRATTPTQNASQAAHQEMVLMWKPVRLQGVGAASSIINANTHPAGDLKLSAWRKQVVCLFGLGIDGSPNTWNASCGAGWHGFNATPNQPQVDRLPLEAVVGWDAQLNGNLAEQLQEPSLMGALEGAGITVLAKGLNFHNQNPFDPALEAGFPAGTTLLTASTSANNCGPNTASAQNPFPSSFQCNPSSIDGLGIQDSSQGGGGVFVHGWAHNLQIANNRINNNSGTLSGGINLGQGEFPPAVLGGAAAINAPPGSCQSSNTNNLMLPYCHNLNVNVHNNAVTSNSSTGDELFSASPAGAGGVSICTGSDFYKFNYNWVCGNLSTGDGGGVAQIGFSYGGDIEHNVIVFNQSTNPTIPTNGGGLMIMGAPDVDPTCGNQVDTDCIPNGSVAPSDGIGPGLVINANLIMGNQAESGSGGGLALQNVNGTDVVNFPNGANTVRFPGFSVNMSPWYAPVVTNNIIVNNVAGWDGGGVSLLDALNVNFINNTVMSNDSTASSGVLFNTIGAPLASTQGVNCIQAGSTTSSCPQPGGLVSIPNSATLIANLASSITCPAGHGTGGTLGNNGGRVNGTCKAVSYPELYNDIFWQNRSFYIGVGGLGTGTTNQQNVVALYNAGTTTPAPSQNATGACPTASYWDIGVRGDLGPTNHGSTFTLGPQASVLTSIAGYPGGGGTNFRINSAINPLVVSQYCNGSRVPPEAGGSGWQVPAGISDATVPNPIFNLTPAATVDEGNNWVNIAWGPLAMKDPTSTTTLGNYALTASSLAIGYITPALSNTTYAAAPSLDFFNNPRKSNNAVDVGAVEFQLSGPAMLTVSPSPLVFGNLPITTSATLTLTLNNTGGATATGITLGALPTGFSRSGGTCGATLNGATACTINVTFSPTAVQSYTAPLTITASVAVAGAPVTLSGAGIAVVRSASVSPNPLAFANQAIGTISGAMTVTITNTGNVGLTAGTFMLGGGVPQPFRRATLLQGGAGTCGFSGFGTLAVGAACTYNVVFAPATGTVSGTTFSRTLTVSYATGATITGSPVTLTGTAGP